MVSTAPAAAAAPIPIALVIPFPFEPDGVTRMNLVERDFERRFRQARFFLNGDRPIGHLEHRSPHRLTVDAVYPNRSHRAAVSSGNPSALPHRLPVSFAAHYAGTPVLLHRADAQPGAATVTHSAIASSLCNCRVVIVISRSKNPHRTRTATTFRRRRP